MTRIDSNDSKPVAWLVTGGKTYQDRTFTQEAAAAASMAERKDGARIEPLVLQSDADARVELLKRILLVAVGDDWDDWEDGDGWSLAGVIKPALNGDLAAAHEALATYEREKAAAEAEALDEQDLQGAGQP